MAERFRPRPASTGVLRPDEVVASFTGPFGLYLHVPFCASICPFCPYNKVLVRDGLVDPYFAALRRELELYGATQLRFESLYVGGGTPSLCLEEVGRTIEGLNVVGERAIEVMPNHVTPRTVSRLHELGFDFVSLGIQSLDARVLRRLGRINSVEDNRHALAATVGEFTCVNADLIFDAAFAEPDSFLRDFEECCGFGVDQISTYPLMHFGYTPFGEGAGAPTRRARVASARVRPRRSARVRAALRLDVHSHRRPPVRVDRPRALPRLRCRCRDLHGPGLPPEPLRAGTVRARAHRRRAAPRAASAPRPRACDSLLRLLAALRTGRRPRPAAESPGRSLRRAVAVGDAAARGSRAPRGTPPPDRQGLRPLPRPRAPGDVPPDRAALGGDARGASAARPTPASSSLLTRCAAPGCMGCGLRPAVGARTPAEPSRASVIEPTTSLAIRLVDSSSN